MNQRSCMNMFSSLPVVSGVLGGFFSFIACILFFPVRELFDDTDLSFSFFLICDYYKIIILVALHFVFFPGVEL